MKPRMLLVLLGSAALACGSQTSSGRTTTTAAQMEARSNDRAPLPPPSPPPVMGQMPGNTQAPVQQDMVPRTPEYPQANPRVEVVEQSRDPADLHITARLRSSLLDDASLSTEAKHVRIVTRGRRVILSGQVATARERDDIDARARNFPGVVDVDDYIVVAP